MNVVVAFTTTKSTPLNIGYAGAKYPLHVQTPPNAAYEYYQSKNRAQTVQALGK
jgi:hypothetical protein